jgi:hypothetical protein
MPTKNPSTSTDASEDGMTQPAKKKVQRGRLTMVRSQDRPKCNSSRPDNHNVAPLLADYASAKISKTAASLQPISLGVNKTKRKTKQSQSGENKRKAPGVDSITMPADTKGATDPLMDDADVDLVTAPGDTKCKNIPAASAATLSLPTDRSTKITRPPPGDVAMEALPRPAGTSTISNAATDDNRSKSPTAGPSTAAGFLRVLF